MSTQAIIALAIFALTIILFVSRKFPMSFVAMASMALMVLTGCLQPAKALSQFGSSNIVLVGAIFVISGAFAKTQFIGKIAAWIAKKCRGNLVAVTAGYLILEVFLAQFVGSTAGRFCMVYPLAVASYKEMKVSPSKIIYPLAVVSMVSSGILPTTSAISMVESYAPMFTNAGFETGFSLAQYGVSRLLITLAVLPIAIFYLPKHMPAILPWDKKEDTTANADELLKTKQVYQPWQENVIAAVFLAVCLGFIFNTAINKVLPLSTWLLALIGALVVVGIGALRGPELYNNLGLSVLFITIGAGGIAAGLTDSGASEVLGNALMTVFGSHPNSYVFGICFFLLSSVTAQFITNIPSNYTYVPIILILCKAMGANPVGPVLLCISGGMAGFVLPTANIVSGMMYPLGGYELKDLAKKGIPMILISAVFCTAVMMTLYPLF